jgi:hypothetical protein
MSNEPKAVFPFNSLSCKQTPFQFPKDKKIDDIPLYKSSEIRLFGSTAGPGRVLARANRDGLLIEENPQILLSFERQNFTITDTILHFPGMHRLPGEEKPSAGELHIYFRNQKAGKRLQAIRDDVCLVIPIKIGIGTGVQYFEFLNRDAMLRSEYLPALTKVLTDKTPAILYKGKDLKNRGCGMPNPESQCLPEAYTLQHIVFMNSLFIRAKDVERLKTTHRTIEQEPPSDPIGILDLQRFCAYFKSPGIRIGSSSERPTELPAGVTNMESLKCRALDPKRDIKGDKIILDPKARSVHLPSELKTPQQLEEEDGAVGRAPSAGGIQPGDFEDYIAVPLGVMLGYWTSGLLMMLVQKLTRN